MGYNEANVFDEQYLLHVFQAAGESSRVGTVDVEVQIIQAF